MARYNAVNDQAQLVASTPFKQYSTDPNAFVAPLNSTQQAGIAGTTAAAGQAQPYYDQATGQLTSAQAGLQPYVSQAGTAYDQAGGYYGGAAAMAQPYIGQAAQGIAGAQGTGTALAGQSLASLQAANDAAAPLQGAAAGNISGGLAAAQPYNQQATHAFYQGLGAAQPLLTSANQNIQQAQAGAQPYQGLATGLALAGTQAVNPSNLDAASIGQYVTPYLSTVLGAQQALQAQQMKQAISSSNGDAIKAGAFGGDRAGIAAANVAQQLQIANNASNAQTLNQAYEQALGTAQQQQGVGLGAAQSNRAALAAGSPQLAAIGQQGYGQGLGAASAQASLGGQEAGLYSGLGSNLEGLGSTLYGQQTGTGQAQAALASQLFGQGATTAAQQAALGQQQYGQGLSAAQAQAGLGQQQFDIGSQTGTNLTNLGGARAGLGQLTYNAGANTAQGLASLGTGAQGAALSGAQAQLAAGQTAQQTQQAGLTALYNQFLQQQSYPFQVSQFLANIAEGTGALSGSTTTTTQPAGFFSDKRLKENVKPIGKTFDGQPIFSYRYKGDPRTQIGLVAQEVEKSHPDAVGEAQGFKTVDYGKATEGSAKRGKFAGGGLAGFDPELAQQMLANGQGMYGPYLTAGGGPYGGMGRVPTANVPMHELKTAGQAPAPGPSTAHQAKEIADTGTEIQKDFGQLSDFFGKKTGGGKGGLGSAGDPDLPSDYADGGSVDPYGQDKFGPGLNIPQDQPDVHKLEAPGQPGKSGSSPMGDVKDAAQAAAAVAKIAAMFAMKRGGAVGRGHYDDGGVVDPDLTDGTDPKRGLAGAKGPDFDAADAITAAFEGGKNPREGSVFGIDPAAHPEVDVSKLTPEGAKAIRRTYWDQIGADHMPAALAPVAYDTAVNLGVGRTKQLLAQAGADPGRLLDLRQAHYDSLAKANPDKYGPDLGGWTNRVAKLRAGLQPAADVSTDADADALPRHTGLAAASPQPNPAGPRVASDAGPPTLPGLSAADIAAPAPASVAQDHPAPSHKKGLLASLTEPKTLIPLLDFIGAMGTAKTNNFGSALAAGVMGGAQGLAGQQRLGIEQRLKQRELDISQQQAGISQQRANTETLDKLVGVANNRFTHIGTNQWRDNLNGGMVLDDQAHAREVARLVSAVPGFTPAASLLATAAQPRQGQAGTPDGAQPAQPGVTTPPAPAGASPSPAAAHAAPQPAEAPPRTPAEAIYSRYDANPRVAELRQRADSYAAQANALTQQALDPAIKGTPQSQTLLTTASNLREQGQQALAQMMTMREQLAGPEIATLTEAQKARFGRQNTAQQAAYERATDAQNTLSQVDALRANLKDQKTGQYNINGGPAGPYMARVGSLMTQFGISPALVKAISGTDPNDAAAIEKLRTTLGTEIGRAELAGSPVRVGEFQQFLKTTPGAELPAAASDWILRNVIEPRAQQSVGLYRKVRAMDPLKEDVQSAVFDFQQDHPWWNPKAGAVTETTQVPTNDQGLYLPTSPADLKGLHSGDRFVIPSGYHKGKIGRVR